MSKYGNAILKLRKRKGLTQAELGSMLNVSYQAVSKWENDLSQPDLDSLQLLCKIFGVGLDEFVRLCNGDNIPESSESSIESPIETSAEKSVEELAEIPSVKENDLVCSTCYKKVESTELFQTEPRVICKDCHERREREVQELRNFSEEVKTSKHQSNSWKTNLLISSIAAILFFVFLLSGFTNDSAGEYITTSIILALILFTFLSQILCDTPIQKLIKGSFGHTFSMPGIIFSLNLDSIILVLAYKLVIAPLISIVIALIIFLGGCLLAILLSPFFFPFSLVSQIKSMEENKLWH